MRSKVLGSESPGNLPSERNKENADRLQFGINDFWYDEKVSGTQEAIRNVSLRMMEENNHRI